MTAENTAALTAEPLRGLPSAQTWGTIREMGQALVASGLVPVKTPEAAAAIILKGAELGAPPMQAFAHISVIQGKPTCSAEFQLSLLGRGGVTWSWVKDGVDGEAVIQFSRPGFGKAMGRFSMEDAQRAGLAGKDNWKKWPRNMLRARAVADGARQIGPDLLAGMSYTPEELGAEVDEDGNAVSAVFTVDQPMTTPDGERMAAQPDADEIELADLWAEVGELKKALPEDVCRETLAQFGVVLGQTKRGEVSPDKLRSIVGALQVAHTMEVPPAEPAPTTPDLGDIVEEIRALEETVHNAPQHTKNARKKHVGSDDISTWTDAESVTAYRDHLLQQAKVESGEAN